MAEKMTACVFQKTLVNSVVYQYYGGCGIGDRFIVWMKKSGEIVKVRISRPENASVKEVVEAVKNYKEA